jgi:hypothetical protein
MPTTTCYSYPWVYEPGLPPGTDYYGYITFSHPPVLIAAATSTVTAVPSLITDRITMVDTTIDSIGVGMSVEFTMRNSGTTTVTNWTVYLSIVQP